jgi:hypothetical protein
MPGDQTKMKLLKIFCAVGFPVVLISNIWSISGRVEARGVYDDVCHLRQAHLVGRFGLGGIDARCTFKRRCVLLPASQLTLWRVQEVQ